MLGYLSAYRGYIGTVEYDYEDGIYYGQIAYIDDFVIYQSSINVDDLVNEFHKTVDDYIDYIEKKGIKDEEDGN